jgi:hypothetical protein
MAERRAARTLKAAPAPDVAATGSVSRPGGSEYLVTFGSLVVATKGIVRALPGQHALVVLDPERPVRVADLRPGMRTRWLGTVRRVERLDAGQAPALAGRQPDMAAA